MTGSHDLDHPRALDEKTAEWLKEKGAAAEFVYLPDLDIRGNGHMMMLEKNNLRIAAWITRWLGNNIEDGGKAASR